MTNIRIEDFVETSDVLTGYRLGDAYYLSARETKGFSTARRTESATVRLNKATAAELRDALSGFIGVNTAPVWAAKPGDKLVVVSNAGSSSYTVGETVTVREVQKPDRRGEAMIRTEEHRPGMYASRFARPGAVSVTSADALSTATDDAIFEEAARRLRAADFTQAASVDVASTRKVIDGIDGAFLWSSAPGGYDLWSAIHDTLFTVETVAEQKERRAKSMGFLAPCPPGFGTVLGHMIQQGKEPEDMGLREGIRLAKLAKAEGVAGMWVEASPALADICKRVRAYPADFLAKHLGPTDPAHVLVEAGDGLVKAA